MSDLTQQGIAALKSGDKVRARSLLQQATAANPNDLEAWLWLSGAVESTQVRIECLRQVLRINPNHALARRGLAEMGALNPFSAASPDPAASKPVDDVTNLRAAFYSDEPPTPPAEEPAPAASVTARGMREDDSPRVGGLGGRARGKLPAMNRTLLIALIGVGVLALATLCMGIYLVSQWGRVNSLPASQPAAAAVDNPVEPSAMPSRTPVPTATETQTPAPRPTHTPMPTETLIPPGPTAQVQGNLIQEQVSKLRGLPYKADDLSFNIVNRERADHVLRSGYINDALAQELKAEQRALVMLGLVQPEYDMVTGTLNHLVDNIGGFYLPDAKHIYVLGLRFGGIEHYIYSHEFDHVLIDQNYGVAALKAAAGCKIESSSDACAATTALLEGDATLAMSQWLKQYASKADYRDITMFRPPMLALTEYNPPAFVTENAGFPYDKGLAFVKYLYNLGRWPLVDKAYLNPPTTTEQILHPVKYTRGEGAIPVDAPPIEAALGESWKVLRSSTLGEWMTYLMLADPADPAAQIDSALAEKATAGWGGDHYQLYYNEAKDTASLAAKWVWDSEKEAGEFFPVLFQQLDALNGSSSRLDRPSGECWSKNGQISCIYMAGPATLWLSAPDGDTLDLMKALYPEFQ